MNDYGFGSRSVISHPRRPRLDLLTVRGRRDALEDADVLHRCVGDHQTSVAAKIMSRNLVNITQILPYNSGTRKAQKLLDKTALIFIKGRFK